MSALLALREGPVPEAALARAVGALDAGHPVVRRAALDVLGHVAEHHGQALPLSVARRALELTGDADPHVRAEAAASLALLPPAGPDDLEARERALVSLLEDGDVEVRQEAAAALGDLPSLGAALCATTRDAIGEKLEAEDDRVAFEAAFALASLGDARARAPLIAALRSRRRRLDALEALARLGDPTVKEAVARYAGGLLASWADRLAALRCLVRLGDSDARSRLAARLSARRFEERVHACALAGQLGLTEAAPALRILADTPGEAAREAAIEALGEAGEREDLERLEAWARAPELDPEARSLAAEARRRLERRLESMDGGGAPPP